jgi:hypothetical protein
VTVVRAERLRLASVTAAVQVTWRTATAATSPKAGKVKRR